MFAKNNISNELMQSMQSILEFDISNYDDEFLKQTLEKRFMITETGNITDYVEYLFSNATEAANLNRALNITYTEFFRSPLTFTYLEQYILPRLMETKTENKELRIWSAGCSSGQEAYSVAMLIENINAKKQNKIRYRIIATDISEAALFEAKKAEYSENDIQMIRVKDLKYFFVRSGEKYRICDYLKQYVSFSVFDLLDKQLSYPQESIFGNFDIVICSNILFYYKPVHQCDIIKKLINSMDEHGYLVTSEAERHIIAKFSDLYPISLSSSMFKQERGMK